LPESVKTMNLSVLILTRNEEKNIAACLASVQFASDILVLDDGSTDKTVELAEQAGARVIKHALNGDWGQQQTFGINNVKEPWILLLDADERISEPLAREIQEVVAKNEPGAYWMCRENRFHFNHATHGVLRPDWVCRLMPTKGTRVEGLVHQTIITPYPKKKLTGVMYHYTYDNWEQYLNKLNHYTTLAAEKYQQEGKHVHFCVDILLRPLWAFIKVYFLNGGFLDGKLGWILSVNHYFYTLQKYVKLYYLQRSNGKL
jgi:glycosyltransferase involved in cell wall biosynthesis